MVIVRNSQFIELNDFYKMNAQKHVVGHLNVRSLKSHQQEFKNHNVIFLSIIHHINQLAGYIILIRDKNNSSVQFKRILIDENHFGTGQKAIIAMEHYCITQFKVNRIWLDVFKSNSKAIYIYKKLGYKCFKEGKEDSRVVLFYEKIL